MTALIAAAALLPAGSSVAAPSTSLHACNIARYSDAGFGFICPPEISAGLSPTALPKRELAPISTEFRVSGLAASDGVGEPVETISFEFDRAGEIDTTGLPACGRRQLEGRSSSTARHVCSQAIVGSGHANVSEVDEGSEPVGLVAPLTIFNGGTRGAQTTLLAQAAAPPLLAPVVTAFRIARTGRGKFGLAGSVTIPPLAEGRERLDGFEVRVGRIFGYAGERHGFALARCPLGSLASLVEFKFRGGVKFAGELNVPCTPKP